MCTGWHLEVWEGVPFTTYISRPNRILEVLFPGRIIVKKYAEKIGINFIPSTIMVIQ
jgi:hypothetical protein